MSVSATYGSAIKDMRILIISSFIYFGQCLQTVLLYRGALAIFLISEGFAYAGFIAFWYKAAQSNPNQNLYSGLSLVVYFAFAMFHHSIQYHSGSRDMGSDIRLGKLSYSIIRPFPYLLQATLRSIASSFAYSVLLLPIFIVLIFVTPGFWAYMAEHISSTVLIQYSLALMLALACGWFIRMVIGMFAFDMTQIWGPDTFFIALYYAASGAVYPIDALPSWALNLAKWTPMYYMVGFPVLTLMGRIPAADFNAEFARGSVVLFAIILLMNTMWRRGLKKFEAIGI